MDFFRKISHCEFVLKNCRDNAKVPDRRAATLFCKMTKAHNCAHSLLPPVKFCAHNLRPKGHTYELPRCDSEMYKIHLYPVAFIGMCNFCHCIWVFIFYFISIVYYVIFQLSACTSDTCILKDQAINKSINQCKGSGQDSCNIVRSTPLCSEH